LILAWSWITQNEVLPYDLLTRQTDCHFYRYTEDAPEAHKNSRDELDTKMYYTEPAFLKWWLAHK